MKIISVPLRFGVIKVFGKKTYCNFNLLAYKTAVLFATCDSV